MCHRCSAWTVALTGHRVLEEEHGGDDYRHSLHGVAHCEARQGWGARSRGRWDGLTTPSCTRREHLCMSLPHNGSSPEKVTGEMPWSRTM